MTEYIPSVRWSNPTMTNAASERSEESNPMNNERKRVEEGATPLTNELRAQLVNQLIEAGGRVVWEWSPIGLTLISSPEICAVDFESTTFYLLEDGETPEKFQRPL